MAEGAETSGQGGHGAPHRRKSGSPPRVVDPQGVPGQRPRGRARSARQVRRRPPATRSTSARAPSAGARTSVATEAASPGWRAHGWSPRGASAARVAALAARWRATTRSRPSAPTRSMAAPSALVSRWPVTTGTTERPAPDRRSRQSSNDSTEPRHGEGWAARAAQAPGLAMTTLTPAGPASAFWAPSTVRSSCQSSMASGSAPTEATASTTTRRPGPGHLGYAGQVVDHTGGGFGVHHTDHVHPAPARQCLFDLLGPHGAVERYDQVLHLGPGLCQPFPEGGPVRATDEVEGAATGPAQAAGGRLQQDGGLALHDQGCLLGAYHLAAEVLDADVLRGADGGDIEQFGPVHTFSSRKWQAASRLLPAGAGKSGGRSVAHTASARGQRGWNGHPGGAPSCSGARL